MTRWTSRSRGTLASISSRNLRNSVARWRAKHLPITRPVAMSRAANSEGRALADGGVAAPRRPAGAHQEHRLVAVERLDLRLFVDAQDHRLGRRREIEADH